MLSRAGVQVPEIPLMDVVGKVKGVPEQIGSIWVKIGVGSGVMGVVITISIVSFIQEDSVGLKVYICAGMALL